MDSYWDSVDEDKSLKQDAELQDVPPPYTGSSETKTIAGVNETVASDSIDGEMADEEGFNHWQVGRWQYSGSKNHFNVSWSQYNSIITWEIK